ncbi:MAG TPA: phytanoyl-CoA dioxygenase family protein [Polyangiaceae bacterium]|nr:phytanoyl-CoA dioxygenase family protein [Polyangiaceae bacterium]
MTEMSALISDCPLDGEKIAAYARDGFLLGPRILSDSDCDELLSDLERVIAELKSTPARAVHFTNLTGSSENPLWQIVNIYELSPAFARLVRSPALVGSARALLGARELRIWHDQIQYKPAAGGGVNMWHQDTPYWPIHSGPSAMTAWLALDDADEGNGCMRMVRGSHAWGDNIRFLHTLKSFDGMPAHFGEQRLEVQSCPVPRGHVHFHHGYTWHGSPPNLSQRPRRAIAVHYMSEKTLYVAGDHVMRPFVESKPGEPISGSRFPLVWSARP